MVNRIRGNALTLKVGSTEVAGEFNSVVLQSEEASGDIRTFGGSASDWYFTITGIQSLDSTSFWHYCWSNPLAEVSYVFRPLGGASSVGAEDAGVFTGTLIIPERGRLPIGGAADPRSTFSWDGIRFDCVEEPTLHEGA
jgi:hypothetical protein